MKIGLSNMNSMSVQETKQMQNAMNSMVEFPNGQKVNEDQYGDMDVENKNNVDVLENSVKQANKELEFYDKMIERVVHEKTHTIMYILKDTITNEVIREFPPRKIQDMIAKMWEMAGILVDERR
ncbi:MAG: flagellar biosynthesis protein FlaG [Clostridia bacterium]|jgi:uncharacterized FlaG/YvyC family protein|nr:flagellar biosynthesis protein FlaG [Clostridia bacterium]